MALFTFLVIVSEVISIIHAVTIVTKWITEQTED